MLMRAAVTARMMATMMVLMVTMRMALMVMMSMIAGVTNDDLEDDGKYADDCVGADGGDDDVEDGDVGGGDGPYADD